MTLSGLSAGRRSQGFLPPPVAEFCCRLAPNIATSLPSAGTVFASPVFQDAQETAQRTAAARASFCPSRSFASAAPSPQVPLSIMPLSCRAAPHCLTHLLGNFLRGCARRHDRSDARAAKLLSRARIHIAAHDHRSIQASRPQALAYSELSQLG